MALPAHRLKMAAMLTNCDIANYDCTTRDVKQMIEKAIKGMQKAVLETLIGSENNQ